MKSNYKDINKLKIKGFTLFELVLSIALLALITSGLLNLTYSSNKLLNSIDRKINREVEIKYGLDYIINEIDRASYIIPNSIRGSEGSNLEIIIVLENENSIKDRFNHITYQLNNNSIERLSYKDKNIKNNIHRRYFSKNLLLEGIKTFNVEFDEKEKFLKINIEDKTEDCEIERVHYLRGVYYED